MYTDRMGREFEHIYISEKGDKVFHHGTKEITGSLKERLDEVISTTWNNLPLEKQDEINNKIIEKNKQMQKRA